MYNEGDIIRIGDLEDPTRTRFSQLLSKVRNLVVRTRMAPELILEDRVIIAPLLKVCSLLDHDQFVSFLFGKDF